MSLAVTGALALLNVGQVSTDLNNHLVDITANLAATAGLLSRSLLSPRKAGVSNVWDHLLDHQAQSGYTEAVIKVVGKPTHLLLGLFS